MLLYKYIFQYFKKFFKLKNFYIIVINIYMIERSTLHLFTY